MERNGTERVVSLAMTTIPNYHYRSATDYYCRVDQELETGPW